MCNLHGNIEGVRTTGIVAANVTTSNDAFSSATKTSSENTNSVSTTVDASTTTTTPATTTTTTTPTTTITITIIAYTNEFDATNTTSTIIGTTTNIYCPRLLTTTTYYNYDPTWRSVAHGVRCAYLFTNRFARVLVFLFDHMIVISVANTIATNNITGTTIDIAYHNTTTTITNNNDHHIMATASTTENATSTNTNTLAVVAIDIVDTNNTIDTTMHSYTNTTW